MARVFHVVAWLATASYAALTAVTAVTDTLLTVSGNDVRVPYGLNNLLGGYADGSGLLQAEFQSPYLVTNSVYPNIDPFDTATAAITSPIPWSDWTDFPISLKVGENLEAWALNGGSVKNTVIAFLGNLDDSMILPGYGDLRQRLDQNLPEGQRARRIVARATSSTTLTANAWSNCVLTFEKTIPSGAYAIGGLRAQSAKGIAARVNLKGAPYRPGTLMAGGNALTGLDPIGRSGTPFRNFHMGIWGTFENTTPPDIEVLSTAADTSETFELDLIRLPDSP